MEELPLDAFRHSRWPLEQFQLPGRLAADLIIRNRANLELDTVEALWREGSNLGGRAPGVPVLSGFAVGAAENLLP